MTHRVLAMMLVFGIGAALPGYSQEAGPAAAPRKPVAANSRPLLVGARFRLLFTVKELDERGKVVNTREFETTLDGEAAGGRSTASIRTGAKVPMPTGTAGNYTYEDVGVNFDVRGVDVITDSRVEMHVDADLSSVDPAPEKGPPAPLIRQNKWSSDEVMVVGERRTLFSSDELTSKNKLQIELLVTRVN